MIIGKEEVNGILKSDDFKPRIRKVVFRGRDEDTDKYLVGFLPNRQNPITCFVLYHDKEPSFFNLFGSFKIDWSDVKICLVNRNDIVFRDWHRRDGSYVNDGIVEISRDELGITSYSNDGAVERMKQRVFNIQNEKRVLEQQKASSDILLNAQGDRNDFIRSETDNRLKEIDGLRKAFFVGGHDDGGNKKG